MSDELSVSVVVPTHDRPRRLQRLLAALRAQSLGSDAFEVIVVVDGTAIPTLEVLAEEQALGELLVRVVEHSPARGPGAARNAGWRIARAPLIAFTDDDCVPSPAWLACALAAAADAGGGIIQGRTEPDPSELADRGLLSRTVTVTELGPQYETCNIFYPRAMLESLGGFDERYGMTPGGEDTDLAWRAIGAGFRTAFEPDALVFHAVQPLGVRASLRVAARWSGTVRVFAEHPSTRSMLYRGIFWNVWHYLLWRSAVAIFLPRWLSRMLLALHLTSLRGRARAGGAGVWAVPFLIVHDVVECWAIARGAVRHRTLVL